MGFRALSHGHYPGTLIPESVLPGISSMGYFDVRADQDWGIGDHRNEGIEICLQETGRSTLIVDGLRHELVPGTLSVTRPWQLHRLGDPHLGPGRIHWIIIDVGVRRPNQPWKWPAWCILSDTDLRELTKALGGNEHPVWAAGREIPRIFHCLGEWVSDDQPQRHASRILVALNQLCVALLELLRRQQIEIDPELTSRRRTVELFLRELGRNPRMQRAPWTLGDMAGHCGMGRTAFANYCHELTNSTPVEFLNRCRLEQAARRLRDEPAVPVTTIALECGFSSLQYFSRKFSATYGRAPGAWRTLVSNHPVPAGQADFRGTHPAQQIGF